MSKSSSTKPSAVGITPSHTSPNVFETRKAALEAVIAQAESTSGGGRMKGKVGVITGVGPPSGIGTATARLMVREGVKHLYLLDFVDTHLGPLAESLQKSFPSTKISTIQADAASSSAIASLINRILCEEGRLDFFFANAGIVFKPEGRRDDSPSGALSHMKRLLRRADDISEEEYAEVMRVNALSVFIAIKYAAPALAKVNLDKGKTVPGGSLILTASVAGLKSNAGPLPYSASKAAVVSMAQTAAYELAGQNIRVNAICPGLIQTDMTKGLFDLAKMGGKEDKIGVLNPMSRQGLAHEVGEMALFLASDDSSYVNGQAMVVDGGLTSGTPYIRSKL